MALKKASPQQAFLKAAFYGPPGTGKTFSALLIAEGLAQRAGKRVAFFDTERGTDFYAMAIKERAVHPEAFDFDASYTKSLLDVLTDIRSLDTNAYGVVVIDSISHLWDAAIAAFEGKRTKIDSIPMHAWGPIKKPYRELMQRLMDLPAHILILGRQKNLFKNDEFVGVGMRAEGETEHDPHFSARFEQRKKADGTLGGVVMIVEKDRTGILQGRTISNPSFETFEPILPFLGTEQARSEDPDEIAARDSELLNKEEDKLKDKAEKSRALFHELNAKIIGAASMADLTSIAAEAKKSRRYLLPEHSEALNQVYTNRNKELAAKLAPQEL